MYFSRGRPYPSGTNQVRSDPVSNLISSVRTKVQVTDHKDGVAGRKVVETRSPTRRDFTLNISDETGGDPNTQVHDLNKNIYPRMTRLYSYRHQRKNVLYIGS